MVRRARQIRYKVEKNNVITRYEIHNGFQKVSVNNRGQTALFVLDDIRFTIKQLLP